MPYFGAKNRMAQFIADRLNYDDSDIFIDVFGGAGNIILNKPRHKFEAYNDYAEGVVSIMTMLSDPENSRTFIYRLLETEYSEEEFNKQKKILDMVEVDAVDYAGNIIEKELKQLFIKYGVIPQKADKRVYKAVLNDKDIFKVLVNEIKNDKEETLIDFKKLLENYDKLKNIKEEQGYIERIRDLGVNISDIDLAVATYVVYTQSRDGMGTVWSSSKFKSTIHYRDSMAKLFDCAERLEGINIYQIDAMDFFRWYLGANMDGALEVSNGNYAIMNRWIHDPKVMFYCDPSYISTKDEDDKLEGIDWENEEHLSEAIKKKYRNKFKELYKQELEKFYKKNIKDGNKKKELKEKMKRKFKLEKVPKNLGEVYVKSFEYEEHENFLKCICNADAKFMVSNYDLKLYNKYLSPENGWKCVKFETFTSVGNKADNKRVEVLWMNY